MKDEKVLLLRRANTGHEDGNWGLPSGHMEGDESARAATVRETQEEIGLIVDQRELELVHILHKRGTDAGEPKESERVCFFFALTEWSGEPINNEPDKCDALTWFPINALPENTIPYIRQVLEAYRAGILYSEEGW